MSQYAKERAAASVDPLTAANDSISKAFADMQAELLNRVTTILSGIEIRAMQRDSEIKQELSELRAQVKALQEHIDTHGNNQASE